MNVLHSKNRSALLYVLLLMVFTGLSKPEIQAQLLTWTGAGDGTEWNDPLNWLPLQVPGPGNPCVILTGTPTVSIASSALSVSVQGSAKLTVTSFLTLGAAITVGANAELIWTGGLITCVGPIINQGKLIIKENGAQTLAGGFGIESSGEIHIDNSTAVSLNSGGSITNDGLMVFKNSGDLIFNAGGDLVNNANIEFTKDDANIVGFLGELDNNGVISKTGGTGENEISLFLDNSGNTLEVQSGKIKCKSGGKFNNSFLVLSANTTVELDGEIFELNGTLHSSPSGTFELNDAELEITGPSSLNFNGTQFKWNNGNIKGTGTLTLPAGVNSLLSGNNRKDLIGPVEIINHGHMTLTNAGDLQFQVDAKLTNHNILEFAQDFCDFDAVTNTSVFTNTGTFRKTGGAGTNIVEVFFKNTNGFVESQTGKISFVGGGELTNGEYTCTLGAQVLFDDGDYVLSGRLTGSPAGVVGHNTVFSTPVAAILDFDSAGFQFQPGCMNGGGELTNAGLLHMVASGNKFLDEQTTLTNSGSVTLSGGNLVLYGNNITVNNHGTFDLLDDSDVSTGGQVNNKQFNNTGTIQKTGGTGTSFFHNSVLLHNQNGILDARSGILEFNSQRLTDGIYLASLGARLDFTGTLAAEGTFTGDPAGEVVLTGQFDVADSLIFNFGGEGFRWESGCIEGGGTVTNRKFFHLVSSAIKYLCGKTDLVNDALLTHSGNGRIALCGDSITITNNDTLNFLDDSRVSNSSSFAHNLLINAPSGLILKSGGNGVSDVSQRNRFINQNGTVEVRTGTLRFEGGGELQSGFYHADSLAVLDFKNDQFFSIPVELSGTMQGNPAGDVLLNEGDYNVPDSVIFDFGGTGIQWIAGTITGGGDLINKQLFHFGSSDFKNLCGKTHFINHHIATHRGNGKLVFCGDSIFLINHHIFDIIDNSDLTNSGPYAANHIVNRSTGVFRKSGGTDVAKVTMRNRFFNEDGIIEVRSGTLQLTGGGAMHSGTYIVDAGAQLNFNNNEFFSIPYDLSGVMYGDPAGDIFFTGDTYIVSDTVRLDFGGNGLTWKSGDFTGGGVFVNENLLHLDSTAAKDVCGESTLINNDTMTHGGEGFLGFCGNNVTIQNNHVFEFLDDSDFYNNGGNFNKLLINAPTGVFRKSGGNDLSLIPWHITFVNQGGIVEVQSGMMQFTGGGDLMNGNYRIDTGSVLDLSSSFFDHPYLLSGTLTGNPAGSFLWTGDVFTIADSTFLNIGGTGIQWGDGSIEGGGTLINENQFRLYGNATKSLGPATYMVNNDSLIFGGNGDFALFSNDVTITNNALFEIIADGSFTNTAGSIDKAFINNETAILRKNGGTGISVLPWHIFFNNLGGTVQVDSGTLQFTGGGTLAGGHYGAGPGAVLDFGFDNFFDIPYQLSDTLHGTPQGDILLHGTFTSTDTTVFNVGGAGLQWASGTFNGGGVFVNDRILDLATGADKYFTESISLINNDSLRFSGDGDLFFASPNTFLINNGVFEFQSATQIKQQNALGPRKIINNSELTKTAGSPSVILIEIENNGLINVQSGELRIGGS